MFMLLLGLLFMLKQQPVRSHQYSEQVRSAVQRVFPSASDIRTISVVLTEIEQEEIRKSGVLPFAADSISVMMPVVGDSVIGVAIVDDIKGKDQLITYLLCVNNDLAVVNLEVLEYREPYGGEVRNKSWQIQFQGKRPSDLLRPGREIKNITGATISARAVTNGVHRLLLVLQAIRNRLPRSLATER